MENPMFIREAFTAFAVLHSETQPSAVESALRRKTPDREAAATGTETAPAPRDWVIDWRWLAD